MKTTVTHFGKYNGEEIRLYTLQNENGMTVKIPNYGATITSIVLPDKKGKVSEIVCGFDTFDSYFWRTVERYCSQIKDTKVTLSGQKYGLAKIVRDNNLDGSKVDFDKKVWEASPLELNTSRLEMTVVS